MIPPACKASRLVAPVLLGLVVLLGLASPARADLVADSRALVAQWLDAQGRGDFAAYSALYAARFTGVRRSGSRTVRFDRRGWMKDRARMFKKKMTVTAEAIEIGPAGASARVSFLQRFASGSFRDAGNKQLVVVREAGALRIAREEMLTSTVEGRHAAAATEDSFLHVVAGRVVLTRTISDADEGWASGPPVREGDDFDPTVVTRPVEPTKLPAAPKALLGRRLRLFDDRGSCGEATVGKPRLLGRVVPHFGTRDQWKEAPPTEVAQGAWELSREGHLLVADLTPLGAPCREATWAQPVERPAPTVLNGFDPDPALRALVARAFAQLPAYRTIQADFATYQPPRAKAKPWIAASELQLRAFGSPRPTLVAVAASSGNGCGEFGGLLWAVFEISAGDKPKLTLRSAPANRLLLPTTAVDTDGEGTLELLFHDRDAQGRLKRRGPLYDDPDELNIPMLDCPC